MTKYKIHKDFKNSRWIYAPTSRIGVKIINALNVQAVKKMPYDKDLKVSEFFIEASDGYGIPVIRFEPKEEKDLRPCIVYFHGGGFKIKGSALVAKNLEEYALRLDAVCFMVDYRLLPKYAYPRPFLDAYESLSYMSDKCKDLGIDKERIAIAGASAGGNLTAALALKARDDQGPEICHQMLIYPALDCTQQGDTIRRFYNAPIWNRRKNRSMWKGYLKESGLTDYEYASPLHHKDFSNLPPTYIEVAEYDCLKSEGIAYKDKLIEAGVPVDFYEVAGGVHGYDNYIHSTYIDHYVDCRVAVWQDVFYGGDGHG